MQALLLAALVAAAPDADKSLAPFRAPAEAYAQQISANQPTQADALFDWNALLDKSFRDLSAPKGFTDGFRQGFARTQSSLSQALATAVQQGGTFSLLRLRKVDRRTLALFRMLPEAGGVNYLELELERRPNGTVKAVDVEPYLTGEAMSVTARRLALRAAAESKMTFLDKLAGDEADLIKSAPKLREMAEQLKAGQHEKVLQLYGALPVSMQKEKTTLVQRLTAAQALDDERYTAAMADFEKWHPGDPALDLVVIDRSFLKKEWAKVIAAVDRLDKRVGGDPYLNVIRASTWLQENKLAEAAKALDQSLATEPKLAAAWWARIEVSMKQNAHADTARLLDGVEKELGLALDGVATAEEYASFRASPPGKAWLKAHRGGAKQ